MNEASNFAHNVDKAFYFILGIDLFLLIGLTAIMIFFILKYSRKKHPKPVQIKDNVGLEVTWTIIPLVIVLAMFFYSYWIFNPMHKVPANAMKINVIGKMWNWTFIYGNGKESDKLYLPYNQPVVLDMKSLDVVHSLYIPAFRIKQDVVPGKEENIMWFIPTIKDTFDISCTAYCGVRHSFMLTQAIVIDTSDFQKWLSKLDPKSLKEQMPGYVLIKNNACTGCHSLDGTQLVGPTFKGLFGSTRKVVVNGTEKTVIADETYITNSIIDPGKEVELGFNTGVMKTYRELLKDEDIKQIVEFFKADSIN